MSSHNFSICVFAGSQTGKDPFYAKIATQLGTAIAKQGYTLIYGGGKYGLMGEVANAALAVNGHVIGIIPAGIWPEEENHSSLSKIYRVAGLQERKRMMLEMADAFVALPGGLGTFDEILEVLSQGQLGLHTKPIGLLSLDNYFDPLLSQLLLAHRQVFIEIGYTKLYLEQDPIALLEAVTNTRTRRGETIYG